MYKIPLRRVGTTDDIAKAALFLCSDDASFITASSLFVDGGNASEGFPDAFQILNGDPIVRG